MGAVTGGEVIEIIGDGTHGTVVGQVYLMSGGGRGAAGKSKGKYKSESFVEKGEDLLKSSGIVSRLRGGSLSIRRLLLFPTVSSSPRSFFTRSDNKSLRSPLSWANDPIHTGPPTPATVPTETVPQVLPPVEEGATKEGETRPPRPASNAWKASNPRSVLAPPIQRRTAGEDNRLSAFAPPFSRDTVTVDPSGVLVKEAINTLPPLDILLKTPEHGIRKSAWSQGPPASLRRAKGASNTPRLAPPSSTDSHFTSMPTTPHAVSDEGILSPISAISPVTPFFVYPWGMPVSPVQMPPSRKKRAKQASRWEKGRKSQSPEAGVDKGWNEIAVVWSPAGWAVQDAAMRAAMRGLEGVWTGKALRKTKSYYRSEPFTSDTALC